MRGRLIWIVLVVGLGVAAPASADEVLSPPAVNTSRCRDSSTSAVPFVTVNAKTGSDETFAPSSAEIGGFVDPGPTFFFILYNRVPRDGLGVTTRRVSAGSWFWHARTRNDDLPGFAVDEGPWGQVRRMVVADEAPLFEGWTLRAQRLRARGSCRRVRLRGKIAWSDNDDTPHTIVRLSVRGGGRAITVPLGVNEYDSSFDRVICAPRGRLRVTPTVEDESVQQARGPAKFVP